MGVYVTFTVLRGLEIVSASESHNGGSSLESVILSLCLINRPQILGAVFRGKGGV